MSRVHGKNTQPELLVRRVLSRLNVRYRLHSSSVPGKPDLYVGRCRTAIFVNGCFWHQHGCARSARPKSNGPFWAKKLDDNLVRDARVRANLKQLDIRVVDLDLPRAHVSARPREHSHRIRERVFALTSQGK
jgi:DNA mismatch endonuclease (patch repair protein)